MRELWRELGAAMRMLRTGAGLSLRRVEALSGVGRGTLSQIETGKARPNRDIVEWYDLTLHGDGLLTSMYAEARGARNDIGPVRDATRHVRPGDALEFSDPTVASGLLVAPGSAHVAGWKLHNVGTLSWQGRRLRRVGAHGAPRLIVSAPSQPIPDREPGESTVVDVGFRVPDLPGTYAAYWEVVDHGGRPCMPPGCLAAVLVVVADRSAAQPD